MVFRARKKRRRFKEKSSLLRRFHPKGISWGANSADFDPQAVRTTIRSMGRLFGPRRYFRVDAKGWENLPSAPVMLVSNHSGGTLFLDSWGLLYAWYTHFGSERAIHPAVHELLLGNDKTAPYFAKRGAVQANRHVAERVLSKWRRDLLVMPGGDFDVWRPHRDRYRVRFAGHTGYARIAIAAGVPIVPVANAGAHDTLYVLSDGHRLANLLRLPKLVRAHIWPLHLSLPWGLALGPWPHIPPPVTLRYRLGPAIYPEKCSTKSMEQQVAELDVRVRNGVQAQLNRLAT